MSRLQFNMVITADNMWTNLVWSHGSRFDDVYLPLECSDSAELSFSFRTVRAVAYELKKKAVTGPRTPN
jgi:hypothetical protein